MLHRRNSGIELTGDPAYSHSFGDHTALAFYVLFATIESPVPWITRFVHLSQKMSQSFGRCCTRDYPLWGTINLRARSCFDRSFHITRTAGAELETRGLWLTTRRTDRWSAQFGCVNHSTNLTRRRNSLSQ